MRKIIGISIVLTILVLNVFGQKTVKENISEVNVFSIHELTLKPGVNEKEFEAFVMNKVAPLYRQMKGQDLFLAKGYVGQRTGQYAIFITFPNVKDRNRIYPLTGDGFSEEFKKVMAGKEAMWKKFDTMAEGFDGLHSTDYVRVDP